MRIEASEKATIPGRLTERTRIFLDAIKFEHTIFALPFAYLGMVLAARAEHGWPGLDKVVGSAPAMAGARPLAMALNRLMGAGADAVSPRTADRALPRRPALPPAVLLVARSAA